MYEAAGGAAGVQALAEAWHRRVVADEVVGHAFRPGVDPHDTERLAAYWGRGARRTADLLHRVRRRLVGRARHSGNGEHEELDTRAVACFDAALDEVGIGRASRLHRVLHDYFAWATTVTMSSYPRSPDDVPDGLTVPRWSWDGLLPG